jgi:hypothetical protein
MTGAMSAEDAAENASQRDNEINSSLVDGLRSASEEWHSSEPKKRIAM